MIIRTSLALLVVCVMAGPVMAEDGSRWPQEPAQPSWSPWQGAGGPPPVHAPTPAWAAPGPPPQGWRNPDDDQGPRRDFTVGIGLDPHNAPYQEDHALPSRYYFRYPPARPSASEQPTTPATPAPGALQPPPGWEPPRAAERPFSSPSPGLGVVEQHTDPRGGYYRQGSDPRGQYHRNQTHPRGGGDWNQ